MRFTRSCSAAMSRIGSNRTMFMMVPFIVGAVREPPLRLPGSGGSRTAPTMSGFGRLADRPARWPLFLDQLRVDHIRVGRLRRGAAALLRLGLVERLGHRVR